MVRRMLDAEARNFYRRFCDPRRHRWTKPEKDARSAFVRLSP
jgi:hypothetical protein